jgi:hypothetical protein
MRGRAGTPTDEKALLSHKTRRHAVEREELGWLPGSLCECGTRTWSRWRLGFIPASQE